MRRFFLISLVPLVVACSGPAATPPAPAAVGGPASAVTAPKPEVQPAAGNPEPKQASQASSQSAPKAEAKPSADAKPQAAAPAGPKATIAPPSENHGIALGQPLRVSSNLSALLVTNTTDQVMTFDLKIEYRKGADVSEMTGTVFDLLPKQSRVATANAYKLVPADPEAIAVSVASVRTAAPTTPKSEIAKNVKLSEPKKIEGSSNVAIEVTNNDAKTHNFSLVSAYMQGDMLVAYGEGQAAGLKPGETRTVTVRAVSPMKAHERVDVAVKVV